MGLLVRRYTHFLKYYGLLMRLESPLKIMLLGDDQELGQAVRDALEERGHLCEHVQDTSRAFDRCKQDAFQLVVLDLDLEDGSSMHTLRTLRAAHTSMVILMLTPAHARAERLEALAAGADDFVIKPFSTEEILARMDAALVRARHQPRSRIEYGPLKMDLTNRTVSRAGREVSLTPTEFRILEILLKNQGSVVTRSLLCESLWNPDWEGVTNVIEVHINRLRTKLNQNDQPQLIHTVRGHGYVLKLPRDPDGGQSTHALRSLTQLQGASDASRLS